MRYLLLLYTIVLSNARPVEEEPYIKENDSVAELHRQFELITYVENFKQILSDYVKKEYQHLTINDMKAVKIILEEFLENFSHHLREILKGNVENIDLSQNIEDGIPDENFDIIKRNVKEEFQDINEETSEKIVYTLRKELFKTRRLLDYVIQESKRSLEANSQ
ncbi:PREDICTED: uncharacterized protein LOC106107882 [Papilio polytes]|uniref:uncharacterized protein LOC106107882 n=1 Tax=Papilio polytes TaxID=76194 RepID=UPI0006760354|nr:PREDICTED: uncharacterized protein LOC106107882 [Papilio polytes]